MAEIRLMIDAPSAASATKLLLADLRRHARVDARHAPEELPDDAKSGTGLAIAELLVDGVPAAIVGAMASVVTAFVARRGARKIVLKSGEDEITVEGVDAATQKAALERWLRERDTEEEA